MSDTRYKMSISLNVLNHLGLNLYSNTPAVIAEVIANAWDADATEVKVDFNTQQKTITVTDNGHGMDLRDINDKYLHVGYQKRDRKVSDFRTPGDRKPMGRKGIGKLSLFSIANKIFVYTRKKDGKGESFLMDSKKIKAAIQNEDPSSTGEYEPEQIEFDANIETQGTVIKITELKKMRLTQASISGLRKRIARRFGIIDDPLGFRILVDGDEVNFSDRDYFHKARFLFQYGEHDYAQYCRNLDIDDDTKEKMCFERPCRFDQEGNATEEGKYEVSGWIGVARRSNDLEDQGEGDNLNKITIVVRGKVAQEDILNELRMGSIISKYIYGEIYADFLDEDDEEDIATSSRQRLFEDDSRYIATKKFIDNEMRQIRTAADKLKEKKGLAVAISSNSFIEEWYNGLRPRSLQEPASKIFAVIDQASVDEAYKQNLYADGILAFETLKMNYALERLETIDASNLDEFLSYLSDVDAIEAARYHEIVKERLDVIKQFRDKVEANEKEKVLQEYIFDHLWLLDPAWERATRYANMEERLQVVISRVPEKGKTVRLDIRYRRVAAAHVIIELKRASRALDKTEIESQIRRYIDALENELKKNAKESQYPIESICIVGKLPRGWANPDTRKKDEESLRAYSIKIITYDELIDNAFSAYSKFIEASESVTELLTLLDNIRTYKVS